MFEINKFYFLEEHPIIKEQVLIYIKGYADNIFYFDTIKGSSYGIEKMHETSIMAKEWKWVEVSDNLKSLEILYGAQINKHIKRKLKKGV